MNAVFTCESGDTDRTFINSNKGYRVPTYQCKYVGDDDLEFVEITASSPYLAAEKFHEQELYSDPGSMSLESVDVEVRGLVGQIYRYKVETEAKIVCTALPIKSEVTT